MKTPATPANTAVISFLACRKPKDVPHSYGFFHQSAMALKIPVTVLYRAEEYDSINHKVTRLLEHIKILPPTASHVLYVDATDCLFLRPLKIICDEFNNFGWPIVLGEQAHFYPSTSMCMGKREWLESALERLTTADKLCLKINADCAWARFLKQHAIPARLDYNSRLFCNMASMPFDALDFSKSESDKPLVLKNGSAPSIVHFSGTASVAIPYFAWTLNLVQLPK